MTARSKHPRNQVLSRLPHRPAAAFFAISALRSGVIFAARAAAPLYPIAAAPASFPSSTASVTWPVMMSTMSLPSWTGSRGRGVRLSAMGQSMPLADAVCILNRLGLYSMRLKLTHYPMSTRFDGLARKAEATSLTTPISSDVAIGLSGWSSASRFGVSTTASSSSNWLLPHIPEPSDPVWPIYKAKTYSPSTLLTASTVHLASPRFFSPWMTGISLLAHQKPHKRSCLKALTVY